MPPEGPRIRSPRIRRLKREIEAEGRVAEARFWERVATKGTPLVERAAHDPTCSLVTYLWRGGPATRSVGLFGPQTEFGAFDRLTRLPGSRLWFGSWKMKSDAFGSYLLLPNLPRSTPTDPAGWLRLLKTGKTDPLNPRTFVSPPDPEFPAHPIYGVTSSALQLPRAPDHREVRRDAHAPAGSLKLRWLRSTVLRNRRRIWIYTPPESSNPARDPSLAIFFDGFAYVNEIPTPTILDNLVRTGRIPPTYAVFVDALDLDVRGRELPCNPKFGKFLRTELLPWTRRVLGRSFSAERTALVGFSYGGLCAMYWAMRYPNRFRRVLSQSGSFGWPRREAEEPVRLAREILRRRRLPLRIYMDAGRYEGSAERENGAGQLGSNRHLRDVLLAKGYPVKWQTYTGGHDTYCWRQTLVEALPWVLCEGSRN